MGVIGRLVDEIQVNIYMSLASNIYNTLSIVLCLVHESSERFI